MNQHDPIERPQILGLLTKRAYFAGLAMQAMLSDPDAPHAERLAFFAVRASDALIAELTRTATNG